MSLCGENREWATIHCILNGLQLQGISTKKDKCMLLHGSNNRTGVSTNFIGKKKLDAGEKNLEASLQTCFGVSDNIMFKAFFYKLFMLLIVYYCAKLRYQFFEIVFIESLCPHCRAIVVNGLW